jgi:hypothetical protein
MRLCEDESPLHEKKSSRRKKCSVSWNSDVNCLSILSLDHYSEQELEAVWYTLEEYQAFKNGCKEAIVRMREKGKKIKDNDEEVCCRGLECLTKKGGKIRQRNRQGVWCAVLLEQELQVKQNVFDALILSRVSIMSSLPARKAARDRGHEDQHHQRRWHARRYEGSMYKSLPSFLAL